MDKVREFLNKIAPLIKTEASARGYKICSTVMAQAIIEGRYGTSALALPPYHNHFGLKCGKAWLEAGKPSVNMKTKEEYTVGKLTTINDYFRSYPGGDAEGVKGYYDFISTSRYSNLKTATNYKQYAEMLKSDGYATSSSYVKTLCDTVEKYGLQKYDDAEEVISSYPVLKKGSRGNYVLAWQNYLNNIGYNCGKADSVFGDRTLEAVTAYQCDRGLVPDGIIGPATWSTLKLEK